MIVLINICKEKLHYFEFVKPIEKIVDSLNEKYRIIDVADLTLDDLKNAKKVIICGTSLKDNDFLKYVEKFEWILNFDKPVLGICGGMQIIGLIFGGKIQKKNEIGFFNEKFDKDFLGIKGEQEVYHLHNSYISDWKEFDICSVGNGIPQAVRHKKKDISGVLFHPEVRQKNMLLYFLRK